MWSSTDGLNWKKKDEIVSGETNSDTAQAFDNKIWLIDAIEMVSLQVSAIQYRRNKLT